MPEATLPPTLPDATPPVYPELPPEPRGSWLAQNRKSAILGGIVILLAIAIGATSLWQRAQNQSDETNTTNSQTVDSSTNSGTATTTSRPTFRRYEATVTADQDNDGLSDYEERQAGTKSDTADTDGDTLADYDEVKVYQTDPNKQDTDADGATDGQEVNAGSNPRGPGSLLNLPQAIQQLNNTNQ